MENNLDKYFRDNLQDRKFELKDEYWLGAEKLLDDQDKRRRRRGFFWWFGGGMAVLLLGVVGYLFLSEKGATKPVAAATENPAKTPDEATVASPVLEEINEPSASALSNEKEQDATASTAIPNGQNGRATAKNSSGKAAQNLNNSTSKNIDNQQVANKKSKSTSINPNVAAAKSSKAGSIENRGENSAESSEKSSLQIAEQTNANAQAQSNFSQPATSENTPIERPLGLDFLAILPAFVKGDFGKKDLAVNAANTKIEVAKQRRLHLGLAASQMLLARTDSGEQARIGLRAGLVARYDVRNGFYLSSGLQYQRRGGNFEATKEATAKRFSFGVSADTLKLRPNSLHYLTFPILVGCERNRHQMEVGFLLDFLTGVHGETGSYQYRGEPLTRQFVTDKSGWITTNGYRRFTPTAQLSYRYRLIGNLSVGLTANYTLGGILDRNFEPVPGKFLLKEADKFHLGLQAVYLFN